MIMFMDPNGIGFAGGSWLAMVGLVTWEAKMVM
jgi:hypothetical protein